MLLQTLENKIYCLLYPVCSIFFGLCLVSQPSALCFKTTFARTYWKKNSLLLTGTGSKILSAALPCLCSWCPVHPFKRARAITAEQDGVLSHDLSKSAFDNAVIPKLKCLSIEMASRPGPISDALCALPSIWKNPLVQAVALTQYRCLLPMGFQPSSRC